MWQVMWDFLINSSGSLIGIKIILFNFIQIYYVNYTAVNSNAYYKNVNLLQYYWFTVLLKIYFLH